MLNKNKIDVAQAFLVFMATIGDVEKTAAALDIEPKMVEELAEREGWREKIRRVSMMSKSGKPGDFERAQNRALCFVQAQCIRQQIDRLLFEVAQLSPEELMEHASTKSRDGKTQLSAKFLVDMAGAAEACHRMSYMALNDTVTERAEREADGSGNASNDIHSAIIAALSNPSSVVPPTVKLLEAANTQVEQLVSNQHEVIEATAAASAGARLN